ncbi:helix-turn-helix transcriptional regulator [Hoeflea sp.]|uniref:helix-turn-helix transcriptional regulator n=1 Tax=Hoeflea sp. TaxID=1940281 RepID=UPI003B517015
MTGLQNSRNPARADFDWRMFAQAIRTACAADGRSQWALAEEIGITESDLSRVRGGAMVSVGKAIALAKWLRMPIDNWYLAPLPEPRSKPTKSGSCTTPNVKHCSCASRAEGAPAGRRTGAGVRSDARPAAGREAAE